MSIPGNEGTRKSPPKQDASKRRATKVEFDDVIAGAGGCVPAARLSEDPGVSVCLPEAGGPDKSIHIQAPPGVAAAGPIGLNTARRE